MPQADLPYWLALARVPRIGAKRMELLEAHFGSAAEMWRAPDGELKAAGLDGATLRSLQQARGRVDPEEEAAQVERAGIQAYTWHDEAYPARLREIYDPPPVLFVRGAIEEVDDWSVAVVGTRRVSPYGRQVTETLSQDLAANGITVVSGLARRIAAQGAVIIEQALGIRPKADYFPRRNRIIAGLTLGTLIVEAGEGSGALHTANWANEQNREVFAVPGRITSPTSKACNALIQQGMAKLVTEVGDILEELNLQMVEQQLELSAIIPEDPTQAAVLEHVGPEPLHIDEAVRLAGLPASTVSSTLAMLEMKGLVRQVGPMTYVRR